LTYKQILVIFRNQVIKKTSPYHLSLTPNIAVGEKALQEYPGLPVQDRARLIRGSVSAQAACRSHVAAPRSTKGEECLDKFVVDIQTNFSYFLNPGMNPGKKTGPYQMSLIINAKHSGLGKSVAGISRIVGSRPTLG